METCLDSLVSVAAFAKILMERKYKNANRTGESNSPVWNTSLPQKRRAKDSFLQGLPRPTCKVKYSQIPACRCLNLILKQQTQLCACGSSSDWDE